MQPVRAAVVALDQVLIAVAVHIQREGAARELASGDAALVRLLVEGEPAAVDEEQVVAAVEGGEGVRCLALRARVGEHAEEQVQAPVAVEVGGDDRLHVQVSHAAPDGELQGAFDGGPGAVHPRPQIDPGAVRGDRSHPAAHELLEIVAVEVDEGHAGRAVGGQLEGYLAAFEPSAAVVQ